MPGCDLKDRSDPENGQIKEDKDLKYLLTDFDLRTTGSTKTNNEFSYRNLAEDFDYLIFINKSTNSDFNYE